MIKSLHVICLLKGLDVKDSELIGFSICDKKRKIKNALVHFKSFGKI